MLYLFLPFCCSDGCFEVTNKALTPYYLCTLHHLYVLMCLNLLYKFCKIRLHIHTIYCKPELPRISSKFILPLHQIGLNSAVGQEESSIHTCYTTTNHKCLSGYRDDACLKWFKQSCLCHCCTHKVLCLLRCRFPVMLMNP